MDDFQFWLYIAFAVIYFITRGLKKKNPPKPQNRPGQNADKEYRPQKKPVSFEELLKEFTEGRQEPEEDEDEYEERQPAKVDPRKELEERKRLERQKYEEEGTRRKFADEESKRIYEESVRKANEQSVTFERAEGFKAKMKREQQEEQSSVFAEEIKEMLQDQDEARKAIILSEILNRKY